MTVLFAQPYNIDATGFYFESFDVYEERAAALRDSHGNPVEEFEIQYIDGDNPQLFEAARINQANLGQWFAQLDMLKDDSGGALGLRFLLNDLGYDLETALDKENDVQLYFGELEDYAAELMEDCYDIPDHLAGYIDYAKFARDLEISGDCVEVDHGVWCINAAGL
jgi:hypothetical protein